MTENQIVRQLQGIAGKLTADPDLQKDLMQEMFVHLVHIQTVEAGQTLGWYLKSCEFHARNFLKLGRSIDSPKRPAHDVSLDEAPNADGANDGSSARPVEIQGELITNDMVNRILPQLSDMQQQILFLLMKGCGVRETGREVGITHPAVIKHRKKIARVAHALLHGSEDVGVAVALHHGANSNGTTHAN